MQQREVIINNDAPVPVGLEAPAVAATGTITCGQVADGNTVTIDDGVHTAVTFEFDNNETTTPGNIAVAFAASGGVSAANLLIAINAQATLDVTATATDPASATINLTNDTAGAAGNVAITKVGAPITVTGMAGGLDAVSLYTLAAQLGAMTTAINDLVTALETP